MLLLSHKPPFPTLPYEAKDFSKVIYRPGDRVVITCPEFFERVGYPMSLADARAIVIAEHDDHIRTLLEASGLYKNRPFRVVTRPGFMAGTVCAQWPPQSGLRFRAYHRIVDGMAMILLQNERFGGNSREIHTTRNNHYQGQEFQVLSKRQVKTGLYDAPWGSKDNYTGEYDSYSGGLHNSKTHVLLELAYPVEDFTTAWSSGLWIERCNVKRV